MRLGKDVLEADLYGELGLLPDATASEIRVAYRHKVRASHPDLNREDPEAAPRMTRLNVAAKVLLDPTLRRAYDRAPRPRDGKVPPRVASAPRKAAWFERQEQSSDDEWAAPPAAPRGQTASFGSYLGELRRRDGQLSLQLQELVESLSVRQQVGVAALLFAIAVGLVVMSRPTALMDAATRPTVNVGVYP
jgi:curved DNA-binding protein CbpA